MQKDIVKNQAQYKQAVKYFLKTNKVSNEFLFTWLYQVYVKKRQFRNIHS